MNLPELLIKTLVAGFGLTAGGFVFLMLMAMLNDLFGDK